MNKALKILGGVSAAIILGAIGSGIWERVLAPFLDFVADMIVKLFSSISTIYQDSIYSYAAQLDIEQIISSHIYLFLIFIFMFLMFFAMCNSNENFKNKTYKTLLGIPGILIYTSFLILLFIGTATDKQSYKIRSYSERSIEILRPYVKENEYLLLKSEFLRIENKKDFSEFDKKLNAYSKQHSIMLPNL